MLQMTIMHLIPVPESREFRFEVSNLSLMLVPKWHDKKRPSDTDKYRGTGPLHNICIHQNIWK